jgi:hypothetical protein
MLTDHNNDQNALGILCGNCSASCLGTSKFFFFFFLIGKKSIYIKAQGAQPMYTGRIQKEPTKQAFN